MQIDNLCFQQRSVFFLSFCIALCTLLVALLIIHPVYQSDDDVFYMFTLGGGFGNAPSNILQINYGWHPALGFVVKSLFEFAPKFNWYSLFILICHIVGLTAVLIFLLSRFSLLHGLILFYCIFFFFEFRSLQVFNYTIASMWLSIAGLISLKRVQGKQSLKYHLIASAIFLAGLLLRFHMGCLVLLLMLPLLFSCKSMVLQSGSFKLTVLCLCGALVLWAIMNYMQIDYYKKYDAHWNNSERFRAAYYHIFNHPSKDKAAIRSLMNNEAAYQLFITRFVFDSTVFPLSYFEKIAYASTRTLSVLDLSNHDLLKWILIENRVYLLLCAALILVLFKAQGRMALFGLFYLLWSIALWFGLFITAKITFDLHICFLIITFLYFISYVSYRQHNFKNLFKPLTLIIFSGLTVWILKLMIREENTNVRKSVKTLNTIHELQQHSGTVFFASGLSLDYLPVWRAPARLKVPNFIYYQKFLANAQGQTLAEYGIPNKFPVMLLNEKMRLIGWDNNALKNYLKVYYNKNVLVEVDSSFHTYTVFRLLNSNRISR